MAYDKHKISAKAALGWLQPTFRYKVERWLNHCQAAGILLFVDYTLRTYAEQQVIFAKGRRKFGIFWRIVNPKAVVTYARPGQSLHNFGLAIDVYLLDSAGMPNFHFDPDSPTYQKVVMLAKKEGLAWGGDWRRKDNPHFQDSLAPSEAQCRVRWPGGWKVA